MIIGTTSQFKFKLPCNFSDVCIAKVIFWQQDNPGTTEHPLPIEKYYYANGERKECSCTDFANELSVTLSQEETLRFLDDRKLYVQIRLSTNGGKTYAGKPEVITVYPICENELLEGSEVLPAAQGDDIFLDGGEIA